MWKSDPPSSDRAGLWRGEDGEGGNVLIKVENKTRQPSKRTIPITPQNGNPKEGKVSFGFLFGRYRLPNKVFGLRYQSHPFNNVLFVRLTQGDSF
jgi:hypothetical protein